MKPYKTVIYSFLLGGLLALIAQAMLVCTRTAFTGTPPEFWLGGSVLLLMGVVGCFLGGFGNYQYFEEWATFGALLPFSGFAMAVGMKMHGPYSKGATMGKSVWAGLWLVIWFNVVGAVVCILFGFIMTMAGWQTPHFDANSTPLVFPGAFLMGGILTALRPKATKKGAMMGFITLEDLTGQIECLLFPRIYERNLICFSLQIFITALFCNILCRMESSIQNCL